MSINAICRAYPKKVSKVIEEKGVITSWDEKGEIFTPDPDLVAAAQAEIDKEYYRHQRAYEYPDWGTQLDYIYHNGIDKWKTDMVDPIKNKYPKPE